MPVGEDVEEALVDGLEPVGEPVDRLVPTQVGVTAVGELCDPVLGAVTGERLLADEDDEAGLLELGHHPLDLAERQPRRGADRACARHLLEDDAVEDLEVGPVERSAVRLRTGQDLGVRLALHLGTL